MGRPSKLTPEQWAEIERRIAGGEGVRDLAKEFNVSPGLISQKGFSKQAKRVQEAAHKVAEAQTSLAALPVHEQYVALSLAEKLRSISSSMAAGAELGAKNFHRLNALANQELQKVDDASLLTDDKSVAALKTVAVLTKMANDAASTPVNLLAANKETVREINKPPESEEPSEPLRPQVTRAEWLKQHGLDA